MKKKIIMAIICVCILATSIIPTMGANGLESEEVVGFNAKTISFMTTIRNELTDIIQLKDSNGDFIYWRGREFGTPGEQRAASILSDAWNNSIANDVIGNAEFDEVSDDFNDRIGITDIDHFKLVINGTEIPKTEMYPRYGDRDGRFTLFDDNGVSICDLPDAKIIVMPDDAYKKHPLVQSVESEELVGNTYIPCNIGGSTGEKIYTQANELDVILRENMNEDDNTKVTSGKSHIYLIEMEKFKDYDIYDYSYTMVVKRLMDYTDRLLVDLPTPDAFLLADYNDDTHLVAQGGLRGSKTNPPIPGMMINRTLATEIKNGINSGYDSAEFYLRADTMNDLKSNNVIGTIPGMVNDTVFIGAHYDSAWTQGSCDDSGSISVVWGLAKYFSDNEITPYYTLKFVAWAGEEFQRRGSESYVEKYHEAESHLWKYCVIMGAFGYKNGTSNGVEYKKEDLHLNLWHNLKLKDNDLKDDIQDFMLTLDYPGKSGGYGDVIVDTPPLLEYLNQVSMTDAGSFIPETGDPLSQHIKLKDLKVFSLDKGTPLTAGHWYHRDGEQHTKGDIKSVMDTTELSAAAFVVNNFIDYINALGVNSASLESMETEMQNKELNSQPSSQPSSPSSTPSSNPSSN